MSQSWDDGHETNNLAESRPLILPDKFSGEEDLSEWVVHFDNVSMINGWGNNEKIRWLNVRVIGEARAMLTRLTRQKPSITYQQAIEALRQRFGQRELHKRLLESRRKRADENWADLGDALLLLVDKA